MKLNCLDGNKTIHFGGPVAGCIETDFCKYKNLRLIYTESVKMDRTMMSGPREGERIKRG